MGKKPSLKVLVMTPRTNVWLMALRIGSVLLPGWRVRSVRVVVPRKVVRGGVVWR